MCRARAKPTSPIHTASPSQIRYWRAVGSWALKYLGPTPLASVRHAEGRTFFHQQALPAMPDALHQLRVEKREGGQGIQVWIDSLEGLPGL